MIWMAENGKFTGCRVEVAEAAKGGNGDAGVAVGGH